ncbi:MAG TPA: amino acid--tRNA ligase-related protein, partial [archaeon]|nr:amino acid--tRNA ligase-related protein [archaeon]
MTEKDKGKKAVLDGWVHARRDHGGVIFIDLRDRYGITQVVMGEKIKDAHKLRNEYVVEISGTVKERKKGTENKKIKTGKIEVRCEELKILAESETLPIEIDDRITANDEVRLKYRYLDLRRPSMQKNLLFRHKFNMAVRNYLTAQGFIEIETPILVKPTPEGARDYIVPSRINPGMFYALPQ